MFKQCGAASWGFVLVSTLSFASTPPATCNGPAALVAKLKAHPTTENAVVLGSWFASHRQFDCAVSTFRNGLKLDPQSAQLHYLEGLALLANRHTEEATAAIEESVQLQSDVIKPHLLLATLYHDAGKEDAAEEQWRLALQIDPKSEQALEGLSAALMARNDYASAVLLLQDAPRTERLAIALSRALGQMNYLSQAESVLNDAMKLSPNSIPLSRALTVVLVNMHRFNDAIKLVRTTAEAHPNDVDEQVEYFKVLVLLNQYDRARPMAPKLLELRPHDAEVLYLSGIIENAAGNPEQARTHLEEAVTLDPNNFDSRYNLGIVLVQLRQWQKAKENLEKAIELQTPVPEVHFELAKALRGLGETERAAQEMKTYQAMKKAKDASQSAESAVALADKALGEGNTQEAIAKYREALTFTPDDALYRYKLSVALARAGDTEGERAELEQAIKLDPKLAAAHNDLGYLSSRAGDAAGAVEHFHMAVQAAPGWAEAWVNLAAGLAASGRFSEAHDAVAEALRLDPNNADAKALTDQLAREPGAPKQ